LLRLSYIPEKYRNMPLKNTPQIIKQQRKEEQELHECFSLFDNDIVLYKRPIEPSLYQIELSYVIAKEIIQKHQACIVIAIIAKTIFETAHVRHLAREHFPLFTPFLKHFIIVTEDPFNQVNIRFSLPNAKYGVSVVKTFEEALTLIETSNLRSR
jgi:hypothetical protein